MTQPKSKFHCQICGALHSGKFRKPKQWKGRGAGLRRRAKTRKEASDDPTKA